MERTVTAAQFGTSASPSRTRTSDPAPDHARELGYLDVIAATGPIVVFDAQCRLVRINGHIQSVTGWSADLASHRDGADADDPLRREINEGVCAVLAGGLAISERDLVIRGVGPDQPSRTWAVTWYPFGGEPGTPAYVGVVLRDVTEARNSSRRIAQLTDLLQNATDAIIALDEAGNVSFWNHGAARLYGWSSDEALGRPILEVLTLDLDEEQQQALLLELRAGKPVRTTVNRRRDDGTTLDIEMVADLFQGHDGPPAYFVIARDVTEERAATRKAEFLVSMLDATTDGIMVLDGEGYVRYWNASLERLSGWPASQALGRRTIDLIQTSMTVDARIAIGRRVRETGSALYEMTVTRPDGTNVDVEVLATSHHDADGGDYTISVIRDVRERNQTQAELGRVVNARSVLASSLTRLHARETVELTAESVCTEIQSALGVDVVAIHMFLPHGDAGVSASALAVAAPATAPISVGGQLPLERAAYLYERASTGPWVEEWSDQVGDSYLKGWRDAGFDTGTYTPLRHGDALVGLIIAGTRDASIDRLAGLIPSLLEYAALASALMGPDLERRRERADVSGNIREVIEARAFRSVFQPVVDLASRTAIGYEALTRFIDGTPPDVRFAQAAAAGLASNLERATLEASFEAAGPLPASAWLSINCSPSVIADGVTLPRLLDRWAWLTVIEITEHEPIADYSAFRRAVTDLGPRARLSIDDAGAGFASLRHILELGPQFVKLDMGLVRNVDADPARQALIAGMVHFATQVGCSLIAEGVETVAEADRLQALGVRFGQGYLLGRPAAAEDLVRPVAARTGRRPAA